MLSFASVLTPLLSASRGVKDTGQQKCRSIGRIRLASIDKRLEFEPRPDNCHKSATLEAMNASSVVAFEVRISAEIRLNC